VNARPNVQGSGIARLQLQGFVDQARGLGQQHRRQRRRQAAKTPHGLHQRAGEVHARGGPLWNRGASRAGGGIDRLSLRGKEHEEIPVRERFGRISRDALAHEPLVLRRPVEPEHAVDVDEPPHDPERVVRAGELEPAAYMDGRGLEMLRACGLGVRGAAGAHGACDGFMGPGEHQVPFDEIWMLDHPLFVDREHLEMLALEREVECLALELFPSGRRRPWPTCPRRRLPVATRLGSRLRGENEQRSHSDHDDERLQVLASFMVRWRPTPSPDRVR
jgi:hypothetical protein